MKKDYSKKEFSIQGVRSNKPLVTYLGLQIFDEKIIVENLYEKLNKNDNNLSPHGANTDQFKEYK